VDREAFLRKHFADSPHLSVILENGPQAVYSAESLRRKAGSIVKNSAVKTSAASFATGLPGNPVVMVAAGGADVAQYFGFAINLAQQIAYLFGEDELFEDGGELSEAAQIRVIAYLGAMFGAAGAGALVSQTSKLAGANLGKKVAAQALTKTAWYPLVNARSRPRPSSEPALPSGGAPVRRRPGAATALAAKRRTRPLRARREGVAPGGGLWHPDVVGHRPGEVDVEDPERAVVAGEERGGSHREARAVRERGRQLAGGEAGVGRLPRAQVARVPGDAHLRHVRDLTEPGLTPRSDSLGPDRERLGVVGQRRRDTLDVARGHPLAPRLDGGRHCL
jgi:hypothetical protein